jgi:hypothetical protein
LLLASSKTYSGEPLHKLYLEFVEYIKKGDKDYAIAEYDIYDAKGSPYYDQVIIDNAKKIMLSEEFQIEFENLWVNLAGGWIKGPLIRGSELDYKPEMFGQPGFCYQVGIDFGRATNGDATSITVIKIIPGEGARFVRNIAVTGMSIPDQATLIKQVWLDYGGKGRGDVVGICLDNEKLGYAVCDSLKLPSIDPRDLTTKLPPIVSESDNETEDAIRIIKPVNFADKVAIYIMASKMKKGFESGILHMPKDAYKISMSDAEKDVLSHEDREILEAYEEISELKREICNVEVQSNGTVLSFKRNSNRKDKKDRFTSAFLAASEALDYYDKLNENRNDDFIGIVV